MSLFRVTVEYELENTKSNAGAYIEDFCINASDAQMAKYYYHKFTHENYSDVDRNEEESHIHGINNVIRHSLREIAEVEYVNGLSPLRQVWNKPDAASIA